MVSETVDHKEQKKITASVKAVKGSVQKANLVLSLIRGKNAKESLNTLIFTRKEIAKDIHKLLKSAIANAENNFDLDGETLIIEQAYVGKSMVLKRWRARAKGRAARILKPFSKIKLVLTEGKVI